MLSGMDGSLSGYARDNVVYLKVFQQSQYNAMNMQVLIWNSTSIWSLEKNSIIFRGLLGQGLAAGRYTAIVIIVLYSFLFDTRKFPLIYPRSFQEVLPVLFFVKLPDKKGIQRCICQFKHQVLDGYVHFLMMIICAFNVQLRLGDIATCSHPCKSMPTLLMKKEVAASENIQPGKASE